MIRSWSHQLLIIYILTLYVLYTKIGMMADFKNICYWLMLNVAIMIIHVILIRYFLVFYFVNLNYLCNFAVELQDCII